MSVETIPVQFNVPKEGKEVVDFICALVADIKAKKGLAEIGTDSFPKLVAAVEGYASLAEEVKSEFGPDLEGYLAREVHKSLK